MAGVAEGEGTRQPAGRRVSVVSNTPEVVASIRRKSALYDAPSLVVGDPAAAAAAAGGLSMEQMAAADATIGSLPGGRSRPGSLDRPSPSFSMARGGGPSPSVGGGGAIAGVSRLAGRSLDLARPDALRAEHSDLTEAYGTDSPQVWALGSGTHAASSHAESMDSNALGMRHL